ncbi:phosphotransferase family protein [Telluria mixta]|uniref:Phosphotransferase family protein n=1 Tax=Telluria mixta TaxID=34071 RepID=A0ABT2BZD4_9BURK|nr:phosphotransferase family protein [Telluria mixta]MCS0630508.1 phosphotransferase family protein [Telluria mixta]WEM94187.1 phosphotransferase family protein [Telluria mixta]
MTTTNTMIDEARELRDEDRLDAGRLDAYLKSVIPGLEGTPSIRQFHGGASNLTYLIAYGGRAMVLRRPPPGATGAGAHDMLREAAVMAALRPHYPYVPAILARCEDADVIGTPFYVMERLEGVILRSDMPPGLGLDADGVRRLCTTFLDRLVDLHAIDTSEPRIAAFGKGAGYVARQLAGWTGRWDRAATAGVDPYADVVEWLRARQPANDSRLCVIHNDYRFDNVVLDPADPLRIVGVLDWEMATIGDPLMDLGGALAYWVEADDDPAFKALRRQPTHEAGMLTRREAIAYYGARTGMDVSDFAFYEVFGLFRLMVILQQIYRRYALGQTTNEQFAGFDGFVRCLGERCRRLIAPGGGAR